MTIPSVFDAGRFAVDTTIRPFVRSFGDNIHPSVMSAAIDRADRSDANTAAGALWLDEIDRISARLVVGDDRGALAAIQNGTWRADANEQRELGAIREQLAEAFLPVIAPDRADSGNAIGALRGNVPIGAEILQLMQNRDDILVGIPERPVDGDAETWTREYVKVAGQATVVRGDTTSFNRVGSTVSADLRPMHWCAVALADGWYETRRARFANVPNMARKLEAVRRAIIEFWYNAIRDGSTVPGLDFYSLNSIPGLLRYLSPLTIGSAAIGDVIANIIFVLTLAAERSPANVTPNVAIFTDRMRNRLMGTTAAPYSMDDAWDYVSRKANSLGFRVIVGKSFRDYGGSNVDGMLLFNDDPNQGLRRVTGHGLIPVHNYRDATGDITLYGSSGGGLELPVAEGCLLAQFTTT